MALEEWEDTGGGGMIGEYRPSGRSRRNSEERWYILEGVDPKAKWTAIILFVFGVAMLIAGAVMLGIGIKRNSQSCDVSGAAMYVTLSSSAVSYDQVQKDYLSASNTLINQLKQALSSSSSSRMSFYSAIRPYSNLAASSPDIALLGISPSSQPSAVNAIFGLAYTSKSVPSQTDLEKQLQASSNMTVYQVTNSEPQSLNQQVCTVVNSNYTDYTTTTRLATSSTSSAQSQTSTKPSVIVTTQQTSTPPPMGTSSSGPPSTQPSSTSPGQITTASNQPPITSQSPATNQSATSTPSQFSASSSPNSTPTTGPPQTQTTTTGCPTSFPTSATHQPMSSSASPSSGAPTSAATISPTATPLMKDVIVLIDDSTALQNANNYDLIRQWLIGQLIPLWIVGPANIEAAPVTYASLEFNILLSFDEQNKDELIAVINAADYLGKYSPGIAHAFKATTMLKGTRGAPQTVILLSASSNQTDIEAAAQYAHGLNNGQNQVITVAYGGADGLALGVLSAGPSHAFSVPNFNLTPEIAASITNLIYGGVLPTTSAFSPTTSHSPFVFPCNPDVAVIWDTSMAVGSLDEYQKQIDFIAKQLVMSWSISPNGMEGEGIMYTSSDKGYFAPGSYQYTDWTVFSEAIDVYRDFYFATAQPNITGAFNWLAGNLGNRRSGRTYATLLITYSSNLNDIITAIPWVDAVGGNIVIVGMGQNITSSYLQYLTQNVITGIDYGDMLVTAINGELCSHSPPTGTPPINTSPSTMLPNTSPMTTRTLPPSTVTSPPTPAGCPDCIPRAENILITVDASNTWTADDFSKQINFILTLTQNWTHFERVALLGWDDMTANYLQLADFGAIRNYDEFSAIIQTMSPLRNSPALYTAFRLASYYNPLKQFGQQTTLLFTKTGDQVSVQNSTNYASQLRNRGQVAIVGVGQNAFANGLGSLATPGNIASWPDVTNTNGLADQIMGLLNGGATVPTTTSGTARPTSQMPSSPSAVTSAATSQTLASSAATSQVPPASSSSPVASTSSPTLPPSTVTSPPTPAGCSDCIPRAENILITVDASNTWTADDFSKQINFILTLTQNWTHFERVALLGWDDMTANYLQLADFNGIRNYDEFSALIQTMSPLHNPPALYTAFRLATNYNPLKQFGQQTTLLFTKTGDQASVQNASDWAAQVRRLGQVVIVGVGKGIFDNGLGNLASPGNVISWPDVSNTDGLADQIMGLLNGATTITTTTPGTKGPTSQMSSSSSPAASSTSRASSQSASPSPTSSGTTGTLPYLPCNRDVILLLDASNAIQNADNFNSFKQWVINSLVTLWPVGSNSLPVAPFSFANNYWNNMGGSFDVGSIAELQQIIQATYYYMGNNGPNIARALRIASNLTHPQSSLTTILFSASENATDISQARQYANQLMGPNKDVITVLFGQNDGDNLGTISSGTGFHFMENSFSPSQALAANVTNAICNPVPSLTTTTPMPTTQTTTNSPSPSPFNCAPDISLLFDASNALNESDYQKMLDYAATDLIQNWLISASDTEAAIVEYTLRSTSLGVNAWEFNSNSQLQGALNASRDHYIGGDPSITSGLDYLNHHLVGRRPSAPLVTILFTYSSAYNDIYSAVPIAQTIGGNLIVVGVGANVDANNLGYLSGNVFVAADGVLDHSLTAKIVERICTPSTPPFTMPPPTTTSITSTAPLTTQPAPFKPADADIAILFDMSNSMDDDKLVLEKNLLAQLMLNWNHWERIALFSYGGTNDFNKLFGYGEGTDYQSTMDKVRSIQLVNSTASITSALTNLNALANPTKLQRVLLITSSRDPTDLQTAEGPAQNLQARGAVIVLGLLLPDTNGIDSLASPGSAIALRQASEATPVINKLNDLLNPPASTSTASAGPTTQPVTPSPGQPCPDCYPDQANLLLILDASKQDATQFSQQLIAAGQLASTWNHFERAAFAYFSSNLVHVINYEDLSPTEGSAYLQLINMTSMLSDPPNLPRALRQAIGIQPHAKFGPQHIIFFTTTSDLEQIQNAVASAQALQALGSLTVIGVGLANQSALQMLASPGDAIAWSNVNDTQTLVNQTMGTLPHGTPPTTVSTTQGVVSTTVSPNTQQTQQTSTSIFTSAQPPNTTPTGPAFACNVDIALVLDASDALDDDRFFKMNQFLAYNLTTNWNIDPEHGSEAGVFLSTSSLTFNERGYFSFENQQALAYSIMENSGNRFGGDSSIKQGLSAVDSVLYNNHDRSGFETVIIQFTYSSDPDDIRSAYKVLQEMKADYNINYILVGVDKNITDDINGLTEYTIRIADFTDMNLVQNINSKICTKAPLTVTPRVPTTVASTQTMGPTTAAPYIPEKEAILIILDSSVDASTGLLDDQKAIVASLIDGWTHFERVALASYADSLTFNEWIQYYEPIDSQANFIEILQTIPSLKDRTANVSAAMRHTLEAYVPIDVQRVVFFTTTKSPTDFAKAVPSAFQLQAMGSLTVVGMNMNDSDVNTLSKLASPGAAIAVPLQFTTDQISQKIALTLSSKYYSTTMPPTGTTPIPSSTISPTTTAPIPYEPEDADIVIVLDASMNVSTNDLFFAERLVISHLVLQFTHFERIGLATYATASFFQGMNYGDPFNSYDEFMNKLNEITFRLDEPASVASALRNTSIYFNPDRLQRVVLLTATADPIDLGKALPYSQNLTASGSLTIVGVNMDNMDAFDGLGSPGALIPYPNQNYAIDVAAKIRATLSPSYYTSTISSPTGPSN